MFISTFVPEIYQAGNQNKSDNITMTSYSERLRPRHRRLVYLLNCLFKRRSKKTSKLRVIGLCEGNPPVTVKSPPHKGLVTRKCFHLMTLHNRETYCVSIFIANRHNSTLPECWYRIISICCYINTHILYHPSLLYFILFVGPSRKTFIKCMLLFSW